MTLCRISLALVVCASSWQCPAQISTVSADATTPVAATARTVIPALVSYTGVAAQDDGRPIAGELRITFLLFSDSGGGEPLWTETQIIAADAAGRYSVQLGATTANGLPLEVFASGAARWLEVQIAGRKPQPRVLITSVPYAAKSADAATLGGLPASAFVLAGTRSIAENAMSTEVTPGASANVTTTGGTAGYVPLFSSATAIVNSEIIDTGTSVGIGHQPNPVAKLDVYGPMIMRGSMTVSRTGNATAATGYPSYGFDFFSNAYNSSTRATDNPHFQLQSEPVGNNTANTSATFNLLYSNHGTTPVETGLSITPNGVISFAPGQTFPGTGAGTITGVTAGTDLTGGGTSGSVTLNLDTTKVPLLSAANTFAGTQSISSGSLNLPATTSASSGTLSIGGVPFLHGFAANQKNVFVGGAGNFTTSGSSTSAVGNGALAAQTSGTQNTAVGASSLSLDTSGGGNTAVGASALGQNVSGTNNTAVGFSAGASSGALTNATAIGANAVVSQSNSLVLGNTTAGSPGAQYVNVGIGTDTPTTILEASVNVPGALGPTLTLTNAGPNGSDSNGNSVSIAFDTNPPATTSLLGGPSSSIVASHSNQYGDDLTFRSINQSFVPYHGTSPEQQTNMIISATGQIGMFGTLTIEGSGPQNGFEEGYAAVVAKGGSGAFSESDGSDGGDGGDFSGGTGYFATNNGSDGGRFYGGDLEALVPSQESGTTYGGDGIYATPGQSSFVSGLPGNAATLDGDVSVTGTLTAATKDFKIDHPLDPANKYLVHSSVESSEMMNIYTGNVVTDDLGIATVTLPDWFETLNTDFRYQLTTIGRDAHAWIAEEVSDHRFRIATNATHVKVSWQITAIRQDVYAKAHPLVVEEEKPTSERGFYLHPELYGQSAEKTIEWGRHPEQMRRMQALRAAQKTQPVRRVKPPVGAPASAAHRAFTQKPFIKPTSADRPVPSRSSPVQ